MMRPDGPCIFSAKSLLNYSLPLLKEGADSFTKSSFSSQVTTCGGKKSSKGFSLPADKDGCPPAEDADKFSNPTLDIDEHHLTLEGTNKNQEDSVEVSSDLLQIQQRTILNSSPATGMLKQYSVFSEFEKTTLLYQILILT